MTLDELRSTKRPLITAIAAKFGAKNIRIFGSTARGDARADSDVDFLITMEPGRTYLDFVGFWQELEELLGRKIDVVSENGVSPYLRNEILREAVPL